ncbi:hypothetical protein ACHAWF_005364 [Thalassiosira exigua]
MRLAQGFVLFITTGSSVWANSCRTLPILQSSFCHRPPSKALPPKCSFFHHSSALRAKPKRGSVVDSYQTVAVNCTSCRHRLFRYKKKNGTKSNLIKCFVERIVRENPDGELERQLENFAELSEKDHKWSCPNCGANFGRSAMIRGMPAVKLVGGKTRMTKK